MLDESNVLFVQDIQKNCNEPVWTSSSLFHLLSKGSGYGYILKYLNKSIGYILLRSLNDEEEILFESDEIAKYRFVSEPLEELL